jgi:hypothetical protein
MCFVRDVRNHLQACDSSYRTYFFLFYSLFLIQNWVWKENRNYFVCKIDEPKYYVINLGNRMQEEIWGMEDNVWQIV